MNQIIVMQVFLKPAVVTKFITGEVNAIKIGVEQHCKDENVYKGELTLGECAQACSRLTTVISYARYTYGFGIKMNTDLCSFTGCKCYCINTPLEGKCQQQQHLKYDIYRLSGELSYIKKL